MAQHSLPGDTASETDAVAPDVTDTQSTTPKSLTADRLEALRQMQKMDPFCKCILKWLLNGRAPEHKADLFLHVKGLLYKHTTDSHQKFLGSCDPKGMEVHSISGSTW